MSQECKRHLSLWREWQLGNAEAEEVSPEVEAAIGHIASCPQCFDDISRVSFALLLEGNPEELRQRLAAFVEARKEKGIQIAALQNPSVTNYMTKNKGAFERIHSFCKALAGGFAELNLPADVAYTVERQPASVSWVSQVAEHLGVSEKGELSKQANLALEFKVDRPAGLILVNRRTVEGVVGAGQTAQIKVQDAHLSQRSIPDLSESRIVTVIGEAQSAIVAIDAKKGTVQVVLASSAKYGASPPISVLISETGKVISKEATYIHGSYETTFSGISTDNYLLAIDVRDRLKLGKSVSPVGHPPRLPEGPEKIMKGRRNKYVH